MSKARTWFDALHQCQQQGQSYVLVTLLATAGSTPRDGGTKMLVCDDSTYDTIGGGNLEHIVTQRARELLVAACLSKLPNNKQNQQTVEHYPLSSKLAQCCGGATNVLFEVFVSHTQHIAVFGAGHVAQALIPILAQLPLQIQWIDERQAMFEQALQHNKLPSNVKCVVSDEPVDSLKKLPAQSWVLIMTHNHQLDFALVDAALARPDCAYVGMIGSATKARRFCTKLAHQGVASATIERLISPVGLLTVPGKEPINVAVSIAAQLMQYLSAPKTTQVEQKQQWRTNQQLVTALNSKN